MQRNAEQTSFMETRLNTKNQTMSAASSKKTEFLLYLLASLLSLAFAWKALELGRADWRVPFNLPGDGVYYALLTKTLLETGWVHHNPSLSAPFELTLFDFAHFDNFYLLLMKLIGIFVGEWGTVLNVYYILTFPLTAITSLVLFRWLKIHAAFALALSLLYTLQPYHFMRGQGHIMLASYYFIPLLLLVALWLSQCRSLSPPPRDCEAAVQTKFVLNWRLIFSIVICFVASSAGHYYACFACFFFMLASIRASLRFRQWLNVKHFALLAMVTAGGFALNLAPNFAYWQTEGSNRQVSAKQPQFSEQYGLKTAQMIFPVTGHRVRLLARITEKYNGTSPSVNENMSSSIGLIATLGFLGLIGLLVFPRYQEPDAFSIHTLVLLNIGALVLATVGGFGNFFAYLISPQIHGYNRISIFVALFGLVTVGYWLNYYSNLRIRSDRRTLANMLIAAFLLGIGYFDQTNRSFIPNYAVEQAKFYANESFGKQVDDAFPKGSKFFMLPLSCFPFDDGKIGYEHFRAYLHTHGMRWSNPAMLNRRPANWQQAVADKPAPEMLRDLCLAGFDAIWIDHRQGAKPEEDLIQYLKEITKAEPLFDGKSRYVFDLRMYFAELKSQLPENELLSEQKKVFPNNELVFGDAFRGMETSSTGDPHWTNWRWCVQPRGIVDVWNSSKETLRCTVSWTIYPGDVPVLKARIISRLFETKEVDLQSTGTVFSQELSVEPGRHQIKIDCDRSALPSNGAGQSLWFRIVDARLE